MHRPPPPGWPQVSASLFYRQPAQAIDWLCAAFGFEVRLKVEGEAGQIIHSELIYGQGLIMVSGPEESPPPGREFKSAHASPLDLGGRVNQALCLFVDDADAHCATARSHGARVYAEPSLHDYGEEYWADRSYGAYDCEGHQWWFMHRVRQQP